ncbi:hypothetical protein Lal_00018957 [Lupinus albus]|nr:hypothetical protein Lal_00018957 [Lupinus albus]
MINNDKAIGSNNIHIEVWKTIKKNGVRISCTQTIKIMYDVLIEYIQEPKSKWILVVDNIILVGESRDELNEKLKI